MQVGKIRKNRYERSQMFSQVTAKYIPLRGNFIGSKCNAPSGRVQFSFNAHAITDPQNFMALACEASVTQRMNISGRTLSKHAVNYFSKLSHD